MSFRQPALAALLVLVACDDASTPPPDARIADVLVPEIDAAADAATGIDAAPDDAGVADAGLIDAAVDGAPGIRDAALADAALADAAFADAAFADAAFADAASPDAAPPDAGPPLGGFVVGKVSQPGPSRNDWLVRVDLDTGATTTLTSTTDGHILDFAVTADGSVAVYQQNSTLFAVRTDGSQAPIVIDGPSTYTPEFALSPRGDRVAYWRWNVGDSMHTVRLDGTDRADVSGGRPARDAEWSPTGDVLVYELDDDLNWGRMMRTCPDVDCSQPMLPGMRSTPFGFAPDGSTVALVRFVSADTYELWTVNLGTGQAHKLSSQLYAIQGSLRWSRDSRQLAYVGGTYQKETVHVACADGSCGAQLAIPFAGQQRPDQGLEFSADGTTVLAVAQVQNGSPFRLFTLCSDGTCGYEIKPSSDNSGPYAHFAPDGRVVHRSRMPASSHDEYVVDCVGGTCTRTALGLSSGRALVWHAETSRFTLANQDGVFLGEGIGGPIRHLTAVPDFIDDLAFASGGQRVIFEGAQGHVYAVRTDGSELRDLSAGLPAGRLQRFRLAIR